MKPQALVWAICVATLAGCSARVVERPVAQPYEVKVPVYIEREAPSSLTLPYVPTEYPQFLPPDAAGVVYGLTQEGWQRLQTILRTMQTRDQAWRSWATGHGESDE